MLLQWKLINSDENTKNFKRSNTLNEQKTNFIYVHVTWYRSHPYVDNSGINLDLYVANLLFHCQ